MIAENDSYYGLPYREQRMVHYKNNLEDMCTYMYIPDHTKTYNSDMVDMYCLLYIVWSDVVH